MMWKIEKEDCADLDFAISCLFSEAISLSEFKTWLAIVINEMPIEKIPLYIFDLIDFNDALANIDNVIGFVAPTQLSTQQKNALVGIAYLRKINVYDPPVSKEQALAALNKNPHVLDEFRRLFPFIELNTDI